MFQYQPEKLIISISFPNTHFHLIEEGSLVTLLRETTTRSISLRLVSDVKHHRYIIEIWDCHMYRQDSVYTYNPHLTRTVPLTEFMRDPNSFVPCR